MSAIPNTEQYFNRTPISSNPLTASGWLARDGSDFSFSTNSIPPILQTQCIKYEDFNGTYLYVVMQPCN